MPSEASTGVSGLFGHLSEASGNHWESVDDAVCINTRVITSCLSLAIPQGQPKKQPFQKRGTIFHPVFLSFGELAFSNNPCFSVFKYLQNYF